MKQNKKKSNHCTRLARHYHFKPGMSISYCSQKKTKQNKTEGKDGSSQLLDEIQNTKRKHFSLSSYFPLLPLLLLKNFRSFNRVKLDERNRLPL